MSPLYQARLLMPLLEVIRNHLGAGEYAAFRRDTRGFPCIEARTERGNMVAGIDEDGLYAFDAADGRYVCDPGATVEAINDTIRRALNDAREEWA